MPYGTEPFTDRYGDYKQPTVIDYDQINNKVAVNPQNLPVDEILEQHQKDVEDVLKEIVVNYNPYYAGERYKDFVLTKDTKLAWNIKKIDEMKSNSDWLFNFKRYLSKAKFKHISNNKL